MQSLRQSYALFFRRIAAYLVDIILLFTLLAPLGFLLQWLLGLPIAQTGPAIGRTILWNFSIPTWLYFMLCDASPTGATIGKRLLGIHVTQLTGTRLGLGRALTRTAFKLLPWELIHLAAFALSTNSSDLNFVQIIGLSLANLLSIVYLAVAAVTQGRRSVHDLLIRTKVSLVR